MKTKILVCLLSLGAAISPARAVNIAQAAASWWGYTRGNNNGSAEDFIIAGGLNKTAGHGTYDDEWAVVGIVANTIVEHGGYFCPYQIQCANKRKKKKTWTEYYHPTGYDKSKCAWLCETGFGGHNCGPQPSVPLACDTKNQNTASSGKFSGISLKTSGERNGMCESEIYAFDTWGTDPECDTVLGVVKFLDHGVIAGPVTVCCGRGNWKSVDSYVNSVSSASGSQKVLCAEGYKVNAAGNDCVPVNADICATQEMSFCANFPRSGYDSTNHTIQTEGGCVKYFCNEPGFAFSSADNTTCIECATGVKGGANPNTGLCVRCETGQYFDSTAGVCRPAVAYSRIDMQYGKGKTKNTAAIERQCWTVTTPADYAACVKSGGTQLTASSTDASAARAARRPVVRK